MAENRSIDVSFRGSGGTALAGTLQLPAGADGRRVPAVLLVQGSGPTDRDGNQPPALITDLLQQIAGTLAGFGIASLRYDKRGMHANAASLPRDPEALAEFVRWRHFVEDAAAAFRALKSRPEIDPARAGLFGHSEGGLIGLAMAARPGGDAVPAALVLAATPGRPLGVVLREQLERLGRLQGAPDAILQPLLDQNDQIVARLEATGELMPDIAPGLRALYPPYLRLFWQAAAALDPVALVAGYGGPVLVLAGGEDSQVSPDRDALALGAALARRSLPVNAYAIGIVPGVSHNLKPVSRPGDPGFAGPVAEAVTTVLHGWFTGLGWASPSLQVAGQQGRRSPSSLTFR
ncbi:alpha/beta hydrolase family protein [Phreatobacter stygius]|uniref:Alpha/beta hydrolase n=1 Tax=Phreatobacter stygius TaxID=1940610 RepID=A0A4D7B0H5_9HYPH|nr:alpha/beta hydrolase [Phreatobacter stygius]QCI64308.1 alpha/beta hydrolase [Phreatobacter stygius]